MKKRKKILLTGGTGLLGKGFIEMAAGDYQIISIHVRDYVVKDPKATHLVLDLGDKREIDKLFAKYDFDAVIHAAGVANVDYAEKNYAESLESNLIGTLNITSYCRRRGCQMIYVSTNAVFDGTSAPYDELREVHPINKYGQIKVACERVVTETLQHFTIVRPILMYGWNHSFGRANPVTWIIEKLSHREPIHMVNDVYENPLYNVQCGEAIWEVVKRKPDGIFHLAGADVFNRYESARLVARVFDLDTSLIHSVDSSYFPSIAMRPKNTSFVTTRMEKELEIKPLRFEEGLLDMKRKMK